MNIENRFMMKTTLHQETVFRELKEYIKKLIVKPDAVKIYHYTTIEALFSGILVKDATPSKEICLRASDARYMNDPTELKVGLDFLRAASKQSRGNIEKGLSYLYKELSHSYITSFSLHRDNLMMWHMYGKNATGVSLRFDVDKMQEDTKDSMLQCIYFTKEKSDQIEAYLKEFDIEQDAKDDNSWAVLILLALSLFADNGKALEQMWSNLEPLLEFALSLKSPAYEYEQEIRLLSPELEEKNAVKYQLRNNLIVPYIEHYMPKDSLREIMVGPNNDMSRTVVSIQEYLKHMGFEHVKVSPSSVPYRGC